MTGPARSRIERETGRTEREVKSEKKRERVKERESVCVCERGRYGVVSLPGRFGNSIHISRCVFIRGTFLPTTGFLRHTLETGPRSVIRRT